MTRQTVDFGIDLGTTNSALACSSGRRVEIVKNRLQSELTPSVVSRTSQGQLLVGQDALDKYESAPAAKFKRLMGTASPVPLGDGTVMKPEELSAEVLKELRSAARLRYDLDLTHVVITVPAMFQQPQCEATHRAAELAGLSAVVLLQEPIAAATAYLNDAPIPGDYLIYDLGGGTFDVSLVRLRDGEMTVLAHGGDNFLGGADIDRALFDWLVDQLHRSHGIGSQFEQPVLRARVLRSIESARKRLSNPNQGQTLIDLADLRLPVDQVPLTISVLEDLTEPIVSRTIRITRERLDHARVDAADIVSVCLVGGPTMTPYVRQRLKDELGIPLALDQDPMTVVAHGAAVHASGLLKPDRSSVVASGITQGRLELFYDPVTAEEDSTLSGRVLTPERFNGEVRVSRAGGDWETGWIPLRETGFACDLRLGREAVSEFKIELRDLRGNPVSITPSFIAIRRGVAAAQAVTPYKYGVALENGGFAIVVEDGQPLPAPGLRTDLRAARTIRAGSNDELSIYFLEGHSPFASDNVQVGHLRIRGSDLERTLREGEKLEIRVRMDESRRLRARVSIPVYDLDYEVPVRSMIETAPVEDLEASLLETADQIATIGPSVDDDDAAGIIQARRDMEQLEAELEGLGNAQMDDTPRVAAKLAELKARVRIVSEKYAVDAAYREAVEAIARAELITVEAEDILGIAAVKDLRQDAERSLRLGDVKGLQALEVRASEIFIQHYTERPECWIGYVAYLRERQGDASDAVSYHQYLRRAEECLRQLDYEGVRLNGREAQSFLPQSETRTNRFYDAGIR